MSKQLQFEASHSDEDEVIFAITHDSGLARFLAVSVAQEQAVGDDNNMMVECTIHLSEEQTRKLRDWLNGHFPELA